MRLEGTGVHLQLPRGWEGRVRPRSAELSVAKAGPAGGGPTPVVVQAANFALPPTVGDFGGGAVEVMATRDLFLTLFEYGAESVGQPLFAHQGLPRSLRPADLDPWTLRTPLPGMSGVQRFFTESGRPFCLYVAVGSHLRRYRTLPVLNSILTTVRIDP